MLLRLVKHSYSTIASSIRCGGTTSTLREGNRLAYPLLSASYSPFSTHSFHSREQKGYRNRNSFFLSSCLAVAGLGYALHSSIHAYADETSAPPSSAIPENPTESTPNNSASDTKTKKPKRKFKYVIVGAGTAAYHALYSIRSLDPDAEVLLIGQESHNPYERPPLTTEMWSSPDPEIAKNLRFINWDGQEISIYISVEEDFEKPVTFLQGRQAIGLHPSQHIIVLDDYEIITYEKLLLATGAEPKILTNIADEVLDNVSTYRDIEDFQHLDSLTRDLKNHRHIAIVGGSFLGTELATSLQTRAGLKVTQVVSREGPLGNILPPYLAEEVKKRLEAKGISVVANDRVESLTKATDHPVQLNLTSGKHLCADHVVLAMGVEPRVDLAHEGKLEVDPITGAIVVNSELQASISDVYAAGDVASYFDQNIAKRRVFPHFDHAASSGQLAGLNMTGKKYIYRHEPFWWVTLPDGLALHGIGITDPTLETVAVWQEPEDPSQEKSFKVGVIYYLEPVSPTRKRIVGIVLWNLSERVETARKVLSSSSSQITKLEDCIRKVPIYRPEPVQA